MLRPTDATREADFAPAARAFRRQVRRGMPLLIALAVLGGGLSGAGPVWADEASEAPYVMDSEYARKAVDAVIVRPALAVRLGVGAAFFAVTSPLLAAELPFVGWSESNLAESLDFFVHAPSESLERPLGEFF